MTEARPIIVAYDGSEDARHALEKAAELFPDCLAYAVHVWRPTAALGAALLGVSKAVAERGAENLDADAASESDRLAGEAVEIAEGFGLRSEALSTGAEGALWAAIVHAAEEHQAGAIVVGSRGLSRLSSALLGSVSGGVLRHARQPVVVIPHRSKHARRTRPSAERATAGDERALARSRDSSPLTRG